MHPEDRAVRAVGASAYRVPTDQPEADGTLAWKETVVAAVEVTAGDSVGLGWTYASTGAKTVIDEHLSAIVTGTDPFDVVGSHESMVRACRNLGRPGEVATAISAVDIALWDVKAKLLDVPLSALFGRCRDSIPLYGSGGFTTYDDSTTASQLEQWVGQWGIPRVKIKIGESWGTQVARDLHRAHLARKVVGDDIDLFVDANGGYSRKQAVRVGHRLVDAYGVVWFEEPVSSDDLTGLRLVRDQLSADVAAGEYGYDEPYFARMVAAGAVDCLQLDATRCGGYTSWLRGAAIAAASGLEVSCHCAPNLHAPVALHAPNLRHVEYFHDHVRADALLFDGVGSPADGVLFPGGEPGHGLRLRHSEAERYRAA